MGVELGENASKRRVRVKPRLLLYWRGFVYLHRRRQWFDGGAQPITMGAIASYIQVSSLGGQEQDRRFLKFVDALDDVFLTHVAEEQKQKRNSSR